MTVKTFKERFGKVSLLKKQTICWQLANDSKLKEIGKQKVGKITMRDWCFNQLNFDEQLAVTLPDSETLNYFKNN